MWTSSCSHSGQTDVVQSRSATLPVATYPVSCFPQSVAMRVIPLIRAAWAQSCDPALSLLQHQTKGHSVWKERVVSKIGVRMKIEEHTHHV